MIQSFSMESVVFCFAKLGKKIGSCKKKRKILISGVK